MNTTTFDTNRLKDAIGFTMKVSNWGNRRKADMSQVTTDAEKTRMKLSKELIQAKEYDDIKSYFGELRQWIYLRTVPSFFREGFQLTSLKAVDEIEAKMRQSQGEVAELVEKLIAVYPVKIDEAKVALNSQFNPADYPPVEMLRKSFGVSWNYISFSTPEALPPELRQAETEKLQKQMQDAGEQITDALRAGFQELISHAVERLTPGDDGKSKTFRNTILERIQEFIDCFSNRNLLGDRELEDLVNKAQEVLIGVSPDSLRKDAEVREKALKEFKQIGSSLDQFVEIKKNRRFSLDED